jgi:3-hydroxy-9,10-secoandrosta-1,3,5(10)-triene-9,17-dione monooxygenase reductase component
MREVSPAVDPATFRAVLGRFCSGITVITALGPGGPLGLTCQSFSSLSLDPPLVLFSAARTSTTWPRIREVGRLCVNVLAEEHSWLSAAVALLPGAVRHPRRLVSSRPLDDTALPDESR